MGEGKEALKQTVDLVNQIERSAELMGGWEKTIQFDFQGESGPFHITIEAGKMKFAEGAAKDPDIIMTGKTSALAPAVRGVVDISHPISRGDIVITKGQVKEMITFGRIFGATQRLRRKA
jgi:putative sterol carrier protein